MKRKIAVIANGWYNRGIKEMMEGMSYYAEDKGIDIFLFLTYSQYKETEEYNIGEFNIHRLPDFSDFDGVVIVPGSLSSEKESERIRQELTAQNIPAVSIGERREGMGYVSCENYNSVCVMAEHMAEEHGVRRVKIMAGHRENSESNDRIKGIKETFKKYGVTIEESDIFYCNWEYNTVKKATKGLLTSRDGLPDLIMCANDYSAMAVCTSLEEEGYSVPDDVLVTGYDNVDAGRAYSPSITTLAQPYGDMGYGSIEMLYEMIEQGSILEKSYSCHLVIGESCGCDGGTEADEARRKLANKSYINSEENIIYGWNYSNIESSFFRTKHYSELPEILQTHFQKYHDYEQDDFAIVLEHAYKQNIMSGDIDLKVTGYSEDMEILVGLHDGMAYSREHFNSKEIVPEYQPDNRSHIYTILSLHSRNNIFGYVVMKDVMKHIEDRSLYEYVTRLGEIFEKYRKTMRLNMVNAELLELSVKDSLTGLYNRLGYERLVKPYFEEAQKAGKANAILFMDINRMKSINDTYGHLQGDMAIRIIASVIQECIPKEWMAVRYGGDEFIIIGVCEDELMLQYLCERMSSTAAKRGEELMLPYKLSASSGYMLSSPNDDKPIEQYVMMADEYMYKNKRRSYEDEAVALEEKQ